MPLSCIVPIVMAKAKPKNVVTATRMFVRFLIASSRCMPGLDDAIPTIAMWRLATLLQYLPAEDVERIIAACDPSLPLGARDHAIILLMARLGLRGSDVVGLRFPISTGRTPRSSCPARRRATRLPLPQDVGEALLHYLESARPPVDIDRVFITSTPWSTLKGGDSAKRERSGGRASMRQPRAPGCFATQPRRRCSGRAPPADDWRYLASHVDETSAHYAKVDIDLLQHVARPWPEGVLC